MADATEVLASKGGTLGLPTYMSEMELPVRQAQPNNDDVAANHYPRLPLGRTQWRVRRALPDVGGLQSVLSSLATRQKASFDTHTQDRRLGKSARNENQWQADRIAVRMITAPDSGLINLGSGRTADAPWADTSPQSTPSAEDRTNPRKLRPYQNGLAVNIRTAAALSGKAPRQPPARLRFDTFPHLRSEPHRLAACVRLSGRFGPQHWPQERPSNSNSIARHGS